VCGFKTSAMRLAVVEREELSRRASPPANARTNTLPASSTPVFNVTHAHREIDHCVVPFSRAAPGVKAGGREDMVFQPLTSMESKYNEPPEEDNESGVGLVSRARMPLTLNPGKKGITRIPPALADATSRPAGHASRRRAHSRKEQGADTHNKYTKRQTQKTWEIINKQTPKNPRIHCITPQSARTRACYWREAMRRCVSPLVPTASHRESNSPSSSSMGCPCTKIGRGCTPNPPLCSFSSFSLMPPSKKNCKIRRSQLFRAMDTDSYRVSNFT